MRVPKGFAKNYFTLSAIQAHSTQPLMQQVSSRTEAYCLQLAQEEDAFLEEDDPELLIESASLSLPIHAGRPKPAKRNQPVNNSPQAYKLQYPLGTRNLFQANLPRTNSMFQSKHFNSNLNKTIQRNIYV